jgi:hypothetical protein
MACAVAVASCLGLAQSCGFPDHQFISDDVFFGHAHPKGGAAASSPDASTTTGGAAESGGASESGGAAGAGGTAGTAGGAASDGGAITIMPREAGAATGGSAGATMGTGGEGTVDGGDVDSGTPCAPGLDPCDGVCTDLQTNTAHCGNCDTSCGAAQVCASGKCGAPCSAGLTPCTPTGSSTAVCVDTKLDESHCGGCNQACVSPAPPGQAKICEGGQCLVDCGALARCGTSCVDTSKDDTHCGTCANNCTLSGEVCSGGVCKPNCTTPFVACNSTCTNLATDNANCGMCGKACTGSQGCVGGICKALVENCLNGTDDDRDNLIDCADPDCNSGYTCGGSVPVGWQGPIVLWSGAPKVAPSCPSAYPSQLMLAHDQLQVPSYACPSCACMPTGASCASILHLSFDTTSTCTAAAGWVTTVNAGSACQPEFQTLFSQKYNPMSLPMGSVQIDPFSSPPISGSCSPGMVTATIPPPTWGADAEACGGVAAAGGGCPQGQCVPKPTAPFGASLCIIRSGVSTCPPQYPTPKPTAQSGQFYQTYSDGRSCSTCSCGQVGCGTLTVYTHYDNARMICDGTGVNVPLDGNCAAIPPSSVSQQGTETEWLTYARTAPSCGPGTSSLVGNAAPGDPVTVCCQ